MKESILPWLKTALDCLEQPDSETELAKVWIRLLRAQRRQQQHLVTLQPYLQEQLQKVIHPQRRQGLAQSNIRLFPFNITALTRTLL